MAASNLKQKIEKLMRRHLAQAVGYQPIEPLEILREDAGIPVEGVVKLDGNENPYGPSPRVAKALAKYPFYNIYPDPQQRQIRKALEEYVGIGAEHIVAGSGSDELIDLLLRLFLEPGDEVIICEPTFGMYHFSTEVCGGRVKDVPRDALYDMDVVAVKREVSNNTKVIFITNPNNPTGNVTEEQAILELLDTGRLVVVDEAYYEFCKTTVAPLVPKYENLVVLRTFSKWAGLAGLRLGYGIFPLKIAQYLLKIKPPYNINAAAQVAALESLKDTDYLLGTVEAIVAERERLYVKLKEVGFLKPCPSRGNFILCAVLEGDARDVHRRLRERGISVRYFDRPPLRSFIRISVGKPEHTDILIEALRDIGENIHG